MAFVVKTEDNAMRFKYLTELFGKCTRLILLVLVPIGCTSTEVKSNTYKALQDYQCVHDAQYPSQCDQKSYDSYHQDVERLDQDQNSEHP